MSCEERFVVRGFLIGNIEQTANLRQRLWQTGQRRSPCLAS